VLVHCWAGSSRTGLALAAWLALQQRGRLSPKEAVAEVMAAAEASGARRSIKAEELVLVLLELGAQLQ
jgi:protein-tyrosine phosphatase